MFRFPPIQRSSLAVVLAATMFTLIAGCGQTAPKATTPEPAKPAQTAPNPAPAQPAATGLAPLKDPVNVLFALNWLPNAGHVGGYVAQEKGMWKNLGLNVQIERGFGSPDTLRRVATGQANFGIVDANTLIAAKAKDPSMPVKAILNIYHKAPYNVVYVKGRKIKSEKDLATAVLGGTPNAADTQMFAPYLEAVGLPPKAAEFVAMDAATKVSSLLQGKVDVLADFVTTFHPYQAAAQKANLEVAYFLMADKGINPYSLMLVSSDSYIQKNPEVVDRFVKGWADGWAYTSDHLDEGVALYIKNNPTYDPKAELASLQLTLPLVVPPDTAKDGIGSWSKERWQYTADMAKTWLKFEGTAPPVTDLYTDKHFIKVLPNKTW